MESVQFYHFREPKYESDRKHDLCNPIESKENFIIPLLVCPKCGVRGGSNRMRRNFDPAILEEFRFTGHPPRMPLDEWVKERPRWARLLDVPEIEIQPATRLGKPEVALKSKRFGDFIFGPPGDIFVTRKTEEVVRSIDATGVEFLELQPKWRGNSIDDQPPPPISLMVVKAEVWRLRVFPEDMVACEICGRRKNSEQAERAPMLIDESRSSVADFFTMEENPLRVFISTRVCDAFQEAELTNYRCWPASLRTQSA